MTLPPTLLPVKPGAYCYLRGCADDRLNGRQVTAISRHYNAAVIDREGKRIVCPDGWVVAASWLPHGALPWQIATHKLVPITDPDVIAAGILALAGVPVLRRIRR